NEDSIIPPNPFVVAEFPRRVVASLAVCTHFGTEDFKRGGWRFPARPSADDSREAATRERAAGKIDDPSNLADSRAWIFHGHIDEVVPRATVQEVAKFYELMGVPEANIQVKDGPDAKHGMPIDALAGGSARHCEPPEPSFLVKCDYGAAELLLPFLYAGATAPPAGAKATGRILRFDQTAFFDAKDQSPSLNHTG